MNRQLKHIDQVFNKGLKKHKTSVPPDVWARIDHSLDKHKKALIPLWLKWSAAAAILVFAFATGYFLATRQNQSSILYVEKPERIEKKFDLNQPKQHSPEKYPNEKTTSQEFNNFPAITNAVVTENLVLENQILNSNTSLENLRIPGNIDKLNVKAFSKFHLNNVIGKMASISDTEIAQLIFDHYLQPLEPGKNLIAEKNTDSKWSLLAQVAPSYSYRSISAEPSASGMFLEDDLNAEETGLMTYAGTVNLNYHINHALSVETGLAYSKMGQVSQSAFLLEDDGKDFIVYAANTSMGMLRVNKDHPVNNAAKEYDLLRDTTNIVNSNLHQMVNLLEVPLNLKLKLIDAKTTLSLTGGLNPALVIGNNAYARIDGEMYTFNFNKFYRSAVLFSSFSLDMEYGFSDQFSLSMQPTFKYALTPINKNTSTTNQPYSLGWFTGIKYKF